MRLVIIGCGGYIGSHLLDRLLPRGGFTIHGWDPQSRKIEAHLGNPSFHFHQAAPVADDLEGLEDEIARADVVINLAAICTPAHYNTTPLAVIQSNLFDVYPIIRLCARHRRWLMSFSTSEVYGRTIASYVAGQRYDDPDLYELREDETPLVMGPVHKQRWTYACAKQMTERLIYAHHTEEQLPFTIVRPLNFFGPRMDFIPGRDGDGLPRVLACFMAALLNRQPMQLVDGGHAKRTIVSIHDAVDAIVLMLERPEAARNQIFNIGNRANEVTIAQLADLMRRTYVRITGDSSFNDHPIRDVSSEQFYGAGYEDCDRRMPDVSKAERRLGWTPRTPLGDILLETMTYYHDTYGHSVAAAAGSTAHVPFAIR